MSYSSPVSIIDSVSMHAVEMMILAYISSVETTQYLKQTQPKIDPNLRSATLSHEEIKSIELVTRNFTATDC